MRPTVQCPSGIAPYESQCGCSNGNLAWPVTLVTRQGPMKNAARRRSRHHGTCCCAYLREDSHHKVLVSVDGVELSFSTSATTPSGFSEELGYTLERVLSM